ncbi:glycosyl transferase family protein [Bacteroides thetaiotaomicron]|jgi:glycosyltransferase family 4|uniref:Glycosyl transferase family protein n=2 Tax=Bacteroides thetaiotaomicron TaxID=818 RepID=A0A174SJC2_BACT4|nr:glycosyl transferase family protein [Bacteroides thetaiotaomicron]
MEITSKKICLKTNNSMKIIYLYPALDTVGGADRVITEKANYFADHCGYDVYIVTAHQNNAPIYFPLSAKVKHIDLAVDFNKQYGQPLWKRMFIYIKLLRQYKKKVRETLFSVRPDFTITTISRDIDFLHTINDGSIKIAEAHISKPFIRNLHRLAKKSMIYQIIGKIWTRKLDNAIKRMDALVVLTERDAEKWKKIKKATVIPNSLPFYPEASSTCETKKIISVGRLDEQKGYDMLIDAWETVHKQHPDWKIIIYGNGELHDILKYAIIQKHLEDSFILHEPVKDIMNQYLDSSIYVMSSRFEGFGMVLAEAMACGVPCISFDCPYGPSDIIKDYVDGLMVENGNVVQLAQKISELIEQEAIRKRMGQQAKLNIKRYSRENIMQKWCDLFEQLKKERQ